MFWGPWAPFANSYHLKEDFKNGNKRKELAEDLSKRIFYIGESGGERGMRETHRRIDKLTNRLIDSQSDRQTERHIYRQTGRQFDRQTDIQTNRLIDR